MNQFDVFHVSPGPVPGHMKVAVVVARWNELITKQLLEGALDELKKLGVSDVIVAQVPGTWEVPTVAKALIARQSPDAVVALGCIIMGETAHGKLLAGDVSSALMGLQQESGVPIGWGILTPDDGEQALNRAGLKMGNKGREAASAAVEAANVIRAIHAGNH